MRKAAQHCPKQALLTDVGSVKQAIVEPLDAGLARGCRFLGGHPLAGSEKSGAAHSRADLFEGRVALLTPTRNTRAEDYDTLEAFWSQLGSVVIRMTPAEHDQVMALVSHLPHLAAAALVAVQQEPHFRLAGTGLLDTTRIAAGDPELWKQIFLQNRRNLLAALQAYEEQLAAFRAALRDGDAQALEDLLVQAKRHRDALGS